MQFHSLQPFVPSGSNFEGSRQFFIELGFNIIKASDIFVRIQFGSGYIQQVPTAEKIGVIISKEIELISPVVKVKAVLRFRVYIQGIVRLKKSGGSYLSSHDPREILGVRKAEKIDWIEIAWPKPSAKVQRLNNPPLDRYITVKES